MYGIKLFSKVKIVNCKNRREIEEFLVLSFCD